MPNDAASKSPPTSPSALFGDVARMISDIRFPAVMPDSGVLMAAVHRNMDVLSQANSLALEGAQTVARRHVEIMQEIMAELTEYARELASPAKPQSKAVRLTELVKNSYEHTVANMRELSDIMQRSNAEAMALIDTRFRETLDEIKLLAEKSAKAPA